MGRRPRRSGRGLLHQVDEQRNPRTKATVNLLLDRYLVVVELEKSTRTYIGYLNVRVRPMLGPLPLSKLAAARQCSGTMTALPPSRPVMAYSLAASSGEHTRARPAGVTRVVTRTLGD
jgi:hypothetical protein